MISYTARNNRTRRVLAAMLKENTGRALCDSGGYPGPDGRTIGGYGRHWEQNQFRQFDKESDCEVKFDVYRGEPEIMVTHNVYHWLAGRLEYAPGIDKMFDNFKLLFSDDDSVNPDMTDKTRELRQLERLAFNAHLCRKDKRAGDTSLDDLSNWFELVDAFPAWLQYKHPTWEITGLYGDDDPETINTCNHDSLLSQDIQYTYFELDRNDGRGGREVVILMLHNGTDLRWGYTHPRAFFMPDEAAIRFDTDGTIYCPSCNASWCTDDAYHWYGEEYPRRMAQPRDLREYTAIDADDLDDYDLATDNVLSLRGGLLIVEDGKAVCPCCGGAYLDASF